MIFRVQLSKDIGMKSLTEEASAVLGTRVMKQLLMLWRHRFPL
jgi:hypothetical protein